MPLLSATGFATDVRAAEKVIADELGVDPRPWFRFPFGAGARARRISSRLDPLGYQDVGWDVDAKDWQVSSPGRLASSVAKRTVQRGDGAVLLFHGWPRITPLALPDVISRLRDAGATFVPVDELPGIPGLTREAAAVEAGLDAAAERP
jgi:peptidoglycan/xylan/chitin deacetylase (PgdA/CDA1 family)